MIIAENHLIEAKMDKIKDFIRTAKENIDIPYIYTKNKHVIITSILIMNYLMICFLIGKNPFDVIPSWPVSDNREQVQVYLPDIDGKTILTEKRLTEKSANSEIFIKRLVKFVVKGSDYENTKSAVPIDGEVRKVWIYNKNCIIDLYYGSNHKIGLKIKNQQKNFKEALSKTIKENVSGIDKVTLLVKGIPNTKLW